MTISLRVAGSPTSGTAAVTAVNPSVGAGATSNDLSILGIGAKPYNPGVTLPSGWTDAGNGTNGTVASSADLGSTFAALAAKVGAASGSIGNISQSAANSMGAVIITYSGTLSGWDTSKFTIGVDTTVGTNYSCTGADGLDVVAGDRVIGFTVLNSDSGTLSAASIAGMSGITQTDHQGRVSAAVSTGDDIRLYWRDIAVATGSSNAPPTMSFNNTGSTSGTTVFLRLREVALGTVTGAFTFAGDAQGSTATRTGGASGALSFTGTATGVYPAQGSSTGAVAFAGSAAGARTPVATVTGAVGFTGAAAGTRTPTATSTGAVTFTGSGAGQRVPKATSTGALSFTGAAVGTRQPRAVSAGAVNWSGSAGGEFTARGTGAGALTWTSSGSGVKHPVATVTGSISWSGYAASGGINSGDAAGVYSFTGTVTGTRSAVGEAAGAVAFTGSADGSFTAIGAGDGGDITWSTTAFGMSPGVGEHAGVALGDFAFTGIALGESPVLPGGHGSADGAVNWHITLVGMVARMGPLQLGRPRSGGVRISGPQGRDLLTVGRPRKETDG